MKKDEEEPEGYVQKVHRETQRYIQALLSENARLRNLVERIEREKVNLTEEKIQLQDEVLTLREELDLHEQQQALLEQQLTNSEGESLTFAERYVELEEQNTNLANLYAVSYRMHGTLDRQTVLKAIEEIVVNMVGSEELAIFELNAAESALSRVSSHGLEPGGFETIDVGSGLIGRVAASGEAYLDGHSDRGGQLPEEAHLTACVPLKIEGRVSGAIAVFRLLPQKAGSLGPFDYELLDLLATQAATSLYFTALHEKCAHELG
ncbi:MAG: GAF domain-containing protein [bacterium]|nr:GAF domain-containing protein [bacterium]